MCPRLILPILLFAILAVINAQSDGRYRAPSTTTTPRNYFSRYRTPAYGRYQPSGDGRYRAGGDGRYRPSGDGRYRGGNDGRYVHMDVKYVHVDNPGGAYSGDGGDYIPDKDSFGPGGGAYVEPPKSSTTAAPIVRSTAPPTRPPTSPPTRPPTNPPTRSTTTAAPLPRGSGTGEGGNGWRIIQLEDQVKPDGYHYLYETENGILAEENGRIEKLTPTDDGLRSGGFYEYTGDDGALYRVDYVADDRGFVPQGAHIPTPLPYVAKLLAYLEANAKQ